MGNFAEYTALSKIEVTESQKFVKKISEILDKLDTISGRIQCLANIVDYRDSEVEWCKKTV